MMALVERAEPVKRFSDVPCVLPAQLLPSCLTVTSRVAKTIYNDEYCTSWEQTSV